MFVVLADIAHDLAREAVDRGEDAAGNDIALDFGTSNPPIAHGSLLPFFLFPGRFSKRGTCQDSC